MLTIRTALVLPALASSLWAAPKEIRDDAAIIPISVEAGVPSLSGQVSRSLAQSSIVSERRVRIEGLLQNLDQMAGVALQMRPEQADRLEPVIVDLAERTLELLDASALAEPAVDQELTELEQTLSHLQRALNRTVAPEINL